MRRNKKGFTLVELLAVIVILAIITLITVPIVMNIVESSRQAAAKASAYSYMEGARLYYANSELKGNKFKLNGKLEVDVDGRLDGNVIKIEKTLPSWGYLVYDTGNVINGCLTVDGYKVDIEDDIVTNVTAGMCDGTQPTCSIEITGGTLNSTWYREKPSIVFTTSTAGPSGIRYGVSKTNNAIYDHSVDEGKTGVLNIVDIGQGTNNYYGFVKTGAGILDTCTNALNYDDVKPLVTTGLAQEIEEETQVGKNTKLDIPIKIIEETSGINPSDFTKDDITIKVGGIEITPATKELVYEGLENGEYSYTLNLTALLGDGKLTLTVESNVIYDIAGNGNNGAILYPGIVVDNEAPKAKSNPNGGNYTISVGSTTVSANATLNVSDNLSGVSSAEYAWSTSNTIEPDNWTNFSDGDSISGNLTGGDNYLWFRTTDVIGNTTTTKSNSFNAGYAVEYNANGGNTTCASQRKVHGTNLTLCSSTPTRSGYKFLGWSESSNASTATYSAGSSYTTNKSVRLYAVWQELISTTIPTAASYCKTGLKYTGSAQTLTNTAGTGYTFSNNSKTNAGTYTVTATLKDGYMWSDKTTENVTFDCTIGQATPTLTLSATSGTVEVGNTITFTATPSVAGTLSVSSGNASYATAKISSTSGVANTARTVTITGVAARTSAVTITVSFTPTDTTNYSTPSSKTYSVTITNKVYSNGTAIYFNPETNKKCTNYTAPQSLNETKTGCMKWYIFNDDGTSSTVNMILDHNTTAYVEVGNASASNLLTYDTSTWHEDVKTTARVISVSEIRDIVGGASSNFCFENPSQTANQCSTMTKGTAKYKWLFDYTYDCTSYGCDTADSSVSGYRTSTWTSTTKTAVTNMGGIISPTPGRANGIRPVISVSRSIIES